MQVWVTDEQGFFTKCDLVSEAEENMITIGWEKPLYKPKWDGKKWFEGATQEEIDEITKIDICLPTTEERITELERTISDLEIELLTIN